jgi:hypothetical protein
MSPVGIKLALKQFLNFNNTILKGIQRFKRRVVLIWEIRIPIRAKAKQLNFKKMRKTKTRLNKRDRRKIEIK